MLYYFSANKSQYRGWNHTYLRIAVCHSPHPAACSRYGLYFKYVVVNLQSHHLGFFGHLQTYLFLKLFILKMNLSLTLSIDLAINTKAPSSYKRSIASPTNIVSRLGMTGKYIQLVATLIDFERCFITDAARQNGTYFGQRSVSLISAANFIASTGITDSI